jgi:Protein of unknown function (DUF3048) N-terminal domain/Protein of unknown function (DUF3048) C-terminal domain
MIISIVLFMAILSILILLFVDPSPAKKTSNNFRNNLTTSSVASLANCPGCIRRQIDGVYVDPAVANLIPVAVMIDNHPDARPQSGIEKANLVYEAEVEGSYTRLMAVFASGEKIDKIGPVRSARPYFVDWANGLNAVYAHVGGSPDALADIDKLGVDDFNQFYNGAYFWRATDRSAPHNVYTSSDDLNKFIVDNNIKAAIYPSWQYKDDAPTNNSSSSADVAVDYRIPDFQSDWIYDRSGNDYIRYFSGKPELTADNNLIVAKNIVIQIVPATVIDSDLRLAMQDVGSGDATICLDGACQAGHWEKPDSATRTSFSYTGGAEVKFNAGCTWIEVMRPDNQ